MENIYDLKQPEDRKAYLLAYLRPLVNVSSKEAIQSLLYEVVSCAYEDVEKQERSASKGLTEQIKDYIELHYVETTLNISTIATWLGRNPKYIARVFRGEMNEGVLDYINRVRISKAVVLLQLGEQSVKEVGFLVGYATDRSFCRAFTKVMGVTPGVFKANKMKRESEWDWMDEEIK